MVEYKPHGMAPKPNGMPPYAPKNDDGTFRRYNDCNWLFKFLDPRDCPYFSKKGKCGLWFAFVVTICIFVFSLYVVGAFIYELFGQLCLKPHIDDYLKPTGVYDWLMGKKRGGMEWHRSAQRLEEEHKIFREKLATLGWANVPLDTIPGFNCAASREKEERIARGFIMTPRDEEEGGGGGGEVNVNPQAGTQDIALGQVRPQVRPRIRPRRPLPSEVAAQVPTERGGKLSMDSSDEGSEKVILARSFGMGSSTSRYGSSKSSSSRRRRMQRKK